MSVEVIKWSDNTEKIYKIVSRETQFEKINAGTVYKDQICLLEEIRDISKLSSVIKIGTDTIERSDNRTTNYLFDNLNGIIKTGNLIGVINTPKDENGRRIRVEISSRFDSFGKHYFLMYLLSSLWGFDIFDQQISTKEETDFNVVLCVLFAQRLKIAYESGLFKVYKTFKYNDYNFRGSLDISRHIKLNTPFSGKTAYSTREYSYDNDLLCMIRQTISRIKERYEKLWDSMVSRDCILSEIEM